MCGLNNYAHICTPDSGAEFKVKTKAARHVIIYMMDKYDEDMEGSVTNDMHRRMVSTRVEKSSAPYACGIL